MSSEGLFLNKHAIWELGAVHEWLGISRLNFLKKTLLYQANNASKGVCDLDELVTILEDITQDMTPPPPSTNHGQLTLEAVTMFSSSFFFFVCVCVIRFFFPT